MSGTSDAKSGSSVIEFDGNNETVGLTGERIQEVRKLVDRLENALSAAPQIISSIDAAAGKHRESAEEIRELHQACEKADRVKNELAGLAKQLADFGDSSEDKISLLLEALDAGTATRENLQTIVTSSSDTVAQFERIIDSRASGIEEKCDDEIRRIESATQEQKARVTGIIEQQTAALEKSINTRLTEIRKQEEVAREHTSRMTEISGSRVRRLEDSIREMRNQMEYAGQAQEQKMAGIADRLTAGLDNIFDKEIARSRQEIEKILMTFSSSGPHITQLHENVEQAIQRLNRTGTDQISKIQEFVEQSIVPQLQAGGQLLEKLSHSTREANEALDRMNNSREANDAQLNELAEASKNSVELMDKLRDREEWVQPILTMMTECAEGSDATIKKIEMLIQDVWTLTTTCQNKARQLTERCESASTIADRIDSTNKEAEARESTLNSQNVSAGKCAEELVEAITWAGDATERIEASCGKTSKSLEQAGEAVYKAQAAHHTVGQLQSIATETVKRVESVLEAARESAQQVENANGTAETILSSISDSIVQIERAEKEASTKVSLLGTQNLDAQRKAEVLVSALSRSRDIIERIESGCTMASQSASAMEEKTGKARSIHESLAELLSNSADAIQTMNIAVEDSSESSRHLEDRSHWAKDLVQQMESRVERVEQAEKEAAARAETLGAQNIAARRHTEEMVDAITRSSEIIEQIDAGCDRASQSATEIEEASGAGRMMHDALAGLLSNAEGVSEKIKAAVDTASDRTARIEDRNRAASELLQRMETTAESYGNLSNEIRTRCEEARQVSKTVNEALKQGAKIKAELDLTNEKSNSTSRDAAQMLATMVEHRQVLQTGEQALNEFLERADRLGVNLQQLQTRADSFGHQLNGMLADPRRIIDEAKTQSGQLDSVCRAVRKVFSGLSQASLQANRDITRFAQISRDANGRLSQLSVDTQRAGQTLREWVDEATHVQSRLAKSIAQVPPVEQTHPTSSLTDLAKSSSEAIAEILRPSGPARGIQRQNLRPKELESVASMTPETKGDFGSLIREAENAAGARQ